MKYLDDDEQLNMRIESFLARKHQQHPGWSFLGNEKKISSIDYVMRDKFFGLLTRRRAVKYVR